METATKELTTMEQIEAQALAADEARSVLRAAADEVKVQVDAVRSQAIVGMRVVVRNYRERVATLADLVKEHPEAFLKPKSRNVHGWSFGYRKKPGRLEVKDEGKTMELIRKHHPDLAAVLIASRESVVKDALNQLSAKDLKRIGVSVVDDCDQPFCKPIGDDVSALVDTLLGPELAEALQA